MEGATGRLDLYMEQEKAKMTDRNKNMGSHSKHKAPNRTHLITSLPLRALPPPRSVKALKKMGAKTSLCCLPPSSLHDMQLRFSASLSKRAI